MTTKDTIWGISVEGRSIFFGMALSMFITVGAMIAYGDNSISRNALLVTAAYWTVAFVGCHAILRAIEIRGWWY